MASYSTQDLELSGDLENYNNAKEAIVSALAREGFITYEQAELINENYAIVIVKNNWLGQAIGRLLGKKDVQYIKLMKLVQMANNSNSSNGLGFGTVLFLVFLVLKLTNYIDWSWWWVTAPLWIPILIIGIIGLVAVYYFHK